MDEERLRVRAERHLAPLRAQPRHKRRAVELLGRAHLQQQVELLAVRRRVLLAEVLRELRGARARLGRAAVDGAAAALHEADVAAAEEGVERAHELGAVRVERAVRPLAQLAVLLGEERRRLGDEELEQRRALVVRSRRHCASSSSIRGKLRLER